LGQRVNVNELLEEGTSGVKHFDLERGQIRELAEIGPC
jgi:hypothetical protein